MPPIAADVATIDTRAFLNFIFPPATRFGSVRRERYLARVLDVNGMFSDSHLA
jgi:hypothetical protein